MRGRRTGTHAAARRNRSNTLNPVAPTEREPLLDALRGFAILGILLVNIEIMRGPDWLVLTGGGTVSPPHLADRIAQFVLGWLATAKFISSLAILFGVGAALITQRAAARAESPRPLLARRYAWLMAFGLAHMLLYPGDVLFVYGVSGLALLAFIALTRRAIVSWSIVLMTAFFGVVLVYSIGVFAGDVLLASSSAATSRLDESIQDLLDETVAAYGSGSVADIASVHASHAVLLQGSQIYTLPWILALFLVGFAIGQTGIARDVGAWRPLLRRGAFLGLAIGLPANLGLGYGGPLSGYGSFGEPLWVTLWIASSQLLGAPVLAVGYLCTLSLCFLRRGVVSPLAAVGRMALTAYVLESALALAFFGGLRLYGKLSMSAALLIVAGIWAALLVVCPLWLRRFQLGPLEWLWRSLTYGRLQPLSAPSASAARRQPMP
jgi:uncharacterized protein